MEQDILLLALDPSSLPRFCRENNDGMVSDLIRNGAEVNRLDADGISPLHAAVIGNSQACIDVLLSNDAFYDIVDSNQATPLHYASKYGFCDLLETLVTKALHKIGETSNITDKTSDEYLHLAKSFVCYADEDGNSALHIAAIHGHSNCVDCLLSYGADMESRSSKERTPLHLACAHGSEDVIDILIDVGADMDAIDSDGNTPIHLCAIGGYLNCIDLLAASGSDIMSKNEDGLTILHLACLNKKANVACLILKGGEGWEAFDDVDVMDEFGRTPLHAAASVADTSCCQLLLKSSATLKKLDEDQKSAICWITNQPNPPQGDKEILACLQQFWSWWQREPGGPALDHQDERGRNALHYACFHGLLHCVKFLVAKKFDVTLQDESGRTPFHYAMNSLACVQFLLKHGGSVTSKDYNGAQPIHMASYFGNTPAIEELLKEAGACVSVLDDENNTPLHYLANHVDVNPQKAANCIEFLLKFNREMLDTVNSQGATPILVASSVGNTSFLKGTLEVLSKMELCFYLNAKNSAGYAPIHVTAIYGHYDTFVFLMHNGANTTALATDDLSALHVAVLKNQGDFIQQIIDTPNFAVNVVDKEGCSPFFYACKLGSASLMDAFLLSSKDVDVENFVDYNGNSALHHAVDCDKVGSVRLLLEESEELVNKQNKLGLTPVHIAAAKDNISCLQQLVEADDGADVHVVDSEGRTPLHHAAIRGNSSCANLLIKHSANPNVRDRVGDYPLFNASFNGHWPCVSLLLKHEAKANTFNSKRRTALHGAAWFGSVRICEALLEADEDMLDVACSNGRTALHRAASRDHIKVMEFLMAQGADIEACDSNGATPLMLACFYQKVNAATLLMEGGASTSVEDELERNAMDYLKKSSNMTEAASEIEELFKRFNINDNE